MDFPTGATSQNVPSHLQLPGVLTNISGGLLAPVVLGGLEVAQGKLITELSESPSDLRPVPGHLNSGF